MDTYVVGTPNLAQGRVARRELDRPGCHWIVITGSRHSTSSLSAQCRRALHLQHVQQARSGLADISSPRCRRCARSRASDSDRAVDESRSLALTRRHVHLIGSYSSWGCTIVDPQISASQVTMAEPATVLARRSRTYWRSVLW